MKIFRFLLSFLLFILLALSIQHEPLMIDTMIYQFIHFHLTSPALTSFFRVFTQLGSFKVLLVLDIICYFLAHDKRLSFDISINLILALISYKGLKKVFKRSRPAVIRLIKEKGYSFPSGHSTMSFTIYGYLLYYIYHHVNNRYLKYTLISILVFIIILIGISRIYLGVHYFTDVLAGYLLGAMILQIYIGGIEYGNKEI